MRLSVIAALGVLRSHTRGFGLLDTRTAQRGATTSRPPPPSRYPDAQLFAQCLVLAIASREAKTSKLAMLHAGVRVRQQIRLMISSQQQFN